MKRSVDFRISPAQHVRDRKRAELALGHPLKRSQIVHHFTPTQLVICEDQKYHALLHEASYYKRLEADPAFADAEIAKIEAANARREEEIRLLRVILERESPGATAVVDLAIEALEKGAMWKEVGEIFDLIPKPAGLCDQPAEHKE